MQAWQCVHIRRLNEHTHPTHRKTTSSGTISLNRCSRTISSPPPPLSSYRRNSTCAIKYFRPLKPQRSICFHFHLRTLILSQESYVAGKSRVPLLRQNTLCRNGRALRPNVGIFCGYGGPFQNLEGPFQNEGFPLQSMEGPSRICWAFSECGGPFADCVGTFQNM